jgi:hypothetical protein
MADRMYAKPAPPEAREDVPPDIAALRAADPERRLFSADRAFAEALPDDALPGIDTAEARECAADLGLGADDLRALVQLNGAEHDTTWRQQAEKALATRGFSAADLEGARQLVRRDPRVHAYLDASGLGNHPAVVQRFVELARSQRARGRLK